MALKLEKLLQDIKDGVQDLATLDVVTLTGQIKISSSMPGNTNNLDLKRLYESIEKNAKKDADLEVVAFTHIDFDCDAVNFVKTGAGEGEKTILEAHTQMVKTAQETRQSMIKLVRETIGI
jgi:hypothetical protein